MVGRVRKMLRLQAKTVTLFVNMPVFSGDGSIQKIAGIKLHTGLGGKHFQNASAGRFMDSGGQRQALSPLRLITQLWSYPLPTTSCS